MDDAVLVSADGRDPVKAPYRTAVLDGVVAVPMLHVIIRTAGRGEAMGEFVLSPRLKASSRPTAFVMTPCVAGMIATAAHGGGGAASTPAVAAA